MTGRALRGLAWMLLLSHAVGAEEPRFFDSGARTTALACDRVAAYVHDRDRLAEPVKRADIDVPVAIAQCLKDLEKLPDDARLHYQLGRLYGYRSDTERARHHREMAAAAGYPAAIFVLGYLDFAAAGDKEARCEAVENMRLAAERGAYAAKIAVAAYTIEGQFEGCAAPGHHVLREWLESVQSETDGFLELLLVRHLTDDLERR